MVWCGEGRAVGGGRPTWSRTMKRRSNRESRESGRPMFSCTLRWRLYWPYTGLAAASTLMDGGEEHMDVVSQSFVGEEKEGSGVKCKGVCLGCVPHLQRALREAWMPALAMVTVCCSITSWMATRSCIHPSPHESQLQLHEVQLH